MRIDTRSRPASFVGMQHERANMEAWFAAYQKMDVDAEWIQVEEVNVFKEGDLHLYFTSTATLREIQETAIIARKRAGL